MVTASSTGTDNINALISKSSKSTNKAQENLNKDRDNFLRMLTTQLQNQDPTSPMDTNQVTQQIAMLSQVEQAVATNTKLDALINLMGGGTQLNSMVSYIGKYIEADGNNGELVDGQGANFAYSLPQEAASVKVTITNATGQIVFTGDGTKNAGKNNVIWDGVNSFNGQTMPTGTYSFTITAKDQAGNEIKANTMTTGIVTSVDMAGGKAQVSVGTLKVPVEKLTSVGSA